MKSFSARSLNWFLKPLRFIILGMLVCRLVGSTVLAVEAPAAPGGPSAWTSGAKEGIGTSVTSNSKVWFTLCKGIMTEVYYPLADNPNVQDFQFIVSDGLTFVDLERDDTVHKVELVDPQALTYKQTNVAKSGRYQITKTYITDPDRASVLIQTRFQALQGGPYQLYVLYNPSLNNTGAGDSGGNSGKILVASKGTVASALGCSSDFVKMSSGYSQTESDGLVDLRLHKVLSAQYDSATAPGNLVQIGQVQVGNDTNFVLALAFGSTREEAAKNAGDSLQRDFAATRTAYETGWHQYLSSLKPPPNCIKTNGLSTQYNVALMTLKAYEDKTYPGAHVASLTIPWGDLVNADKPTAGYHHVWSRDLYQVATAQLAAGDRPAAAASLNYLLNTQQIHQPTLDVNGVTLQPGAFPRFSKVDGSDPGASEQLDQDAFPLILAWQLNQGQLNQIDAATWSRIKLTADHIVTTGPTTLQERWEEQHGYSPSTIAAEIAGLVCAADIARAKGDIASAKTYEAKADEWKGNLEKWTYTASGYFGDHQYYVRVDNGDPNNQDQLTFNNEKFWDHDVVDGGILELVRLGVKPPNDPKIAHSLDTIDQVVMVATPSGYMWHRYNHDCYGENDSTGRGWSDDGPGRGRVWPILSGERGEYELANAHAAKATELLKTMAACANDGCMIPEQCWDRADAFGFTFGKGTGSATPLAWSMAQFVRLAVSIDAGFPVETPKVVADRYAGGPLKLGTVTFMVAVPPGTDNTGKVVYLSGELNRLDPQYSLWNPAGLKLTRLDAQHWQAKITGAQGTQIQYKYTLGDWGSVEQGTGGTELPNRVLTVDFKSGSTMTVQDTVVKWRNSPP
jgi:glucoamylase